MVSCHMPPNWMTAGLLANALALLACAPPASPPRAALPAASALPAHAFGSLEPLSPPHQPPPQNAPIAAPLATAPRKAPRFGHATLGAIRLDFVAFDSRTHELRVADQPGGPASQWPDAAAAGRSAHALAAINAGFFTPEGKPLGLVISKGQRRGTLNRSSSLGSGLYLAGDSRGPALLRRELAHTRSGATELLQSGPFLVENGRPLPGLTTLPARDRSFLAWDGAHQWFIGRTSPCSLAALALALADAQPAGFPIRHALNLDGGRSSDLWVSASIPGGPATLRPIWNNPVRNFLLLLPR